MTDPHSNMYTSYASAGAIVRSDRAGGVTHFIRTAFAGRGKTFFIAFVGTILAFLYFAPPAVATAPSVIGESVSGVKATEARLEATVNPENEMMVECHFQYGIGTVSENEVSCESPLIEGGERGVGVNATGLTEKTAYKYRVVLKNLGNEKAEGAEEHFTTAIPPEAPIDTKVKAGSITATSVEVEGELNPGKARTSEPGTYEVLYKVSPLSAPATGECEESAISEPATGAKEEKVSAKLEHLEPNAKYTFCLRARNEATPEGETAVGAPVTFDTKATSATIDSLSVSDVKTTEATLEGTVNPNNQLTECHFQYGIASVSESVVACSPSTLEAVFEEKNVSPTKVNEHGETVPAPIGGLTEGATYKYRIVTKNGKGEESSEEKTFQTFEAPVTGATGEITATTATLHGVLNPNNAHSEEPGSYELVYRPSSTECRYVLEPAEEERLKEEIRNYNRAENKKKAEEKEAELRADKAKVAENKTTPEEAATGTQGEAVQAPVSALEPGTTYTVCALALNGSGMEAALSNPETFTTPAVAPTIASEYTTDVSADSATLDAQIDPGGSETTYHFEYIDQAGYEAALAEAAANPYATGVSTPESPSVGADDSDHLAAAPIQGLAPDTTYHYRVVAASSHTPAGLAGADHTFTTQTTNTAFTLPDNRQWEMVTPPKKEGALIWPTQKRQSANVTQASLAGDAITYLTNIPTENGVVGYTNLQQDLSIRTPTGWVTKDLATAHNGATGESVDEGQEYRFFSEDLSQAILQPLGTFLPCETEAHEPQPCLSPHASLQAAFLHTNLTGPPAAGQASFCTSECFRPLVTGCPAKPKPCTAAVEELADIPEGELFSNTQTCAAVGQTFCGPFFTGATPDARQVVLNEREQEGIGEGALYEWSVGRAVHEQLKPVSVLPAHEGKPEELEGGQLGSKGADNARHAISADGSRVFWARGGAGSASGVYMRSLVAGREQTIQIGGSAASFELASSDGSKVFYSENGALLECEIPEAETLECDPSDHGQPVELGPVQNLVIGASEDDSYLYFVGAGNQLFVDHEEGGVWHKALVATLSEHDSPDWGNNIDPLLTQLTARVSPDGRWLAFMSEEQLTGYDNHDAASGEPDEELYLYHAPEHPGSEAGTLACASCNPTGARPTGVKVNGHMPLIEGQEVWAEDAGFNQFPDEWLAADVPAWSLDGESGDSEQARYQPRFLSDGGRLFFDSRDALVPKDIDGGWDAYEYEPEGVGDCLPAAASGSIVFKPEHHFDGSSGEGMEAAGCVGLLTSGESGQESVFVDASEDGSDVFLLTTSKLAPQDADSAYDIYDAHECTSVSPCVSPPSSTPPCQSADACRAAPLPQPTIFGASPTETLVSTGNAASPAPVTVKSKAKTLTRAEKLAAALKACKRMRAKKKRRACEASAEKKYGSVRKAKKSSRSRRGGK